MTPNRIYKYTLAYGFGRQLVEMPIDAEVLTVQLQGVEVTVWALVDKGQTKTEEVPFHIVGTGQPIDNADSMSYVGTVQLTGTGLVLHVFLEYRMERGED